MRPAGATGAALTWLKQAKIRQGEIGVVVLMQNMVTLQTELTKVGVEGADRTSPGAMLSPLEGASNTLTAGNFQLASNLVAPFLH